MPLIEHFYLYMRKISTRFSSGQTGLVVDVLVNIKIRMIASPHSLLTFSLYILLLQERPIKPTPEV